MNNKRIYWLLKEIIFHPALKKGEVLGIITLPTPIGPNELQAIDDALDIGAGSWTWDHITKAQYETYREFGFKEYTI